MYWSVRLCHSVSNMLLIHDLVTPALNRMVHHCGGLWPGNNLVKCSQVAQVSRWYLVMNHPVWSHAVTRILALNSVLFQVQGGQQRAASIVSSIHLEEQKNPVR